MAEMKLLGLKFIKILAERSRNFSGKTSIKNGIVIGKIERVKDSKDSLEIEFKFNIDYGSLGKIELEGSVYISGDSKTLKEFQKEPKERDMNSKEFVAITNIVLQKASIKALEVETELNLPIHIKLPSINPSK
jgi:hypothetical protein